jgi:xanthine dehydrogenase YagT iron-sulfur-binding subunit
MHFLINGQSFDFEIDVRVSLLDLIREHTGLTGTKKGCNQGACALAPCWSTGSESTPA